MDWVAQFLNQRAVKRIAYIIDAQKPKLAKNPEYEFDKEGFGKRGFKVDFIDLEATEKTDLKKRLENADALYVKGGNTFYLLNAMRKSGFDKLIPDLLDKGVIYIGESAGSYVACPTIEMAHWKHQDADIIGLKDLTALNLVPFLVTVHYKPEFEPMIRPEIEKSKYEVRILKDNQVILLEGDKERLIEV